MVFKWLKSRPVGMLHVLCHVLKGWWWPASSSNLRSWLPARRFPECSAPRRSGAGCSRWQTLEYLPPACSKNKQKRLIQRHGGLDSAFKWEPLWLRRESIICCAHSPYRLDVLPARDAGHGSFLVFGSAVDRQQLEPTRKVREMKTKHLRRSRSRRRSSSLRSYLTSSSLQHLGVSDRFLEFPEDTDLTGDRDRELLVG